MPEQKNNTPAPEISDAPQGREPLHGSGSDDLASRATERAASEVAAAADAAVAPITIPLPRILLDGVVRKNPVLVAGLGLAPALLIADAAAALTIGVCTTLALLVTSLLASVLGGYLPDKFRPALTALVTAGLTVALESAVGALLPDLLPQTGIFISLIAVGGLTLSRAEYSTARPPLAALVDALANGVGYTLALTLIGALRELTVAGSIFGIDIISGVLPSMPAPAASVGGFLTVGLLAALMQGLRLARARRRAARTAAKSNDKEAQA